ncbi:MAG: O-antigen/teichoic acid export membrane protein [Francisellaceae bacterium]|jgi:O-antigen/teichoic acid export membrane protein
MSKKVISNIFNNIFATLINILAPLIIIPILTSGLGMNEYGLYVAMLAKTALFIVLAELGFGMYLGKQISINRDDIAEVSSLFWIFLVTKLVVFFVVLAVLIVFSAQFGVVELLLSALIFFQFLNVTPILTGLENYKLLTKVQIFTKFLMVVLVITVNFSSFGLEKVLVLHVVIAALTSFSLFIYFLKNNKLEKIIFSFTKFKIVLIGSLPFYGAKLFVNLYQQSSTYFVSFLLSAELVAIYSIAIQLYKVGQSIIGAVSRVLYTSTVNTKDFLLIKRLTISSFFIHLAVLPIVFFYGAQILSLIFSFDVKILTELSVIFYLSLLSVIVSSYWGYPALTAIGKENYAHLGILTASVAYFIALGLLIFFDLSSIHLLIGCIVLADFSGMLVRLFFARKFKLL